MIVIRPIRASDYEALYQCAVESGYGFTSLPVDESLLRKRIAGAEDAFHKQVVDRPGEEGYLFVMEDTESQQIMGVSGIEAAVGLSDAFWHYRIGKETHHSSRHGVHKTLETLTLNNDYTGVSELCTLFLREPFRVNRNGRALSKFRLLFMAEFKSRFSSHVIAEMRGVSDEDGNSPFWNWLQKHFFGMDFSYADYLTGIGDKAFIFELMPRHPVYISLLDKAAQEVVGEVHENTLPALKLLKSEGFRFKGYVDIFDAGPTVEAEVSQLRTVKNSVVARVEIGQFADDESETVLMCNRELESFRALQTRAVTSEGTVLIDQATADALNVSVGDTVRLAPF
ncbi:MULTISPECIES: arginine N-succinyltransferase [Gammaproteobacteria]|uniref:arginine N-succinyltransferase n=1 Tax=Gammaproteobacteria TaxID=1236 RepID=UPI000DD068CD|nr:MULTISPECIES: arginine N-succinyltransferase [Gammaproteobacteria]RTE85714.1 arginine N-succinyltransferase [Aliidiomarina sp. B3213]TCZ90284.1 arginine N-succinyltransferase [Lysobacter sp. N42]